jgi:regulator of protease activity HflC (stomatin/prohibitin superfamily)
MGLERLIQWLIDFLTESLPGFIVKEYQEAIVLRWGKFYKHVGKGYHWKIPHVDEVIPQHTVLTTMNLPSQSLVTKDGTNVVVKAVVKYKIFDVKTFTLEVYDSVDAISDVAQGVVKNAIMTSNWEQCRDIENYNIDNQITKKVRTELKKLGVSIENVVLTDIAPIRTIRLINESVLNA